MFGRIKHKLKTIDTLKVIAKEQGISVLKARRKVVSLNKKYSINLNRYINAGFYNRPDCEVDMAVYTSELRRIGVHTDTDFRTAEKEYLAAHKEIGVDFCDYVDKKYYKYTLYDLVNLVARPTVEEQIEANSEEVAYRLGISKEEARDLIVRIHEEHNIGYVVINGRALYKLTDEEIDQSVEELPPRQDYVDIYMHDEACEYETYEEAQAFLNRLAKKFNVSVAQVVNKRYYAQEPSEVRKALRAASNRQMKTIRAMAEEAGITPVEYVKKEMLERYAIGDGVKHYRELKAYLKTMDEYRTFLHNSDKQYFMAKYNVSKEGVEYLLDKKKFDTFFRDYTGREFWFNDDGATFEDFKKFIERSPRDKIFVKAARSSQGNGISTFNISETDLREKYDELMAMPSTLAEHCVIQHPEMAKFGGGCVNTLRVVTIYRDGKCNFIYTVIRIGENDTFDNFSQGGVIAEVDMDSGEITTSGYDKHGGEAEVDRVTGETIKGFVIPFWKEAKELIAKAAERVAEKGVGFVGWDVAITEKGPALIEGNDNPQMNLPEHIGNNKTGHRYYILPYADENIKQ